MKGERVWASLLSSSGERKIKLQKAAEPRNASEACFLKDPRSLSCVCCLPRRINCVGYSPSSGLRAAAPHLPALPPKLSTTQAPPPTVTVIQEKGRLSQRGSGRLLRPHSPTGTAAASADWGSSNSPSRSRLWGLWLGTSSSPLQGVAPPSPLLSPPPESSSGWHKSFKSQGSQPDGRTVL